MSFYPRAAASTLCATLLLVACHSAKKLSNARYKVMDTITVSARNNPMDIYRAASPRIWEIIHTGLVLRFNFERKEAMGEALLTVSPYTHPIDTLTLDAKSMTITSVEVEVQGKHTALPYTYDGAQLKVLLRGLEFGSLTMKRAQDIRIVYKAMPYASPVGGSKAITEDRGLYFINTDGAIPGKPMQIWTQGETESNSHWMPTIDKPNQRSTFDIALIVPDSIQTLSNGQLFRTTPEAGGMRRDEWRMSTPIQVYAAMFAIGRFSVAKDNWEDPHGNSMEVSYYTEPGFGPYAKEMFQNTPDMIGYFSRYTGVSYPWNKYSQIVVRDYVSGAMENTSATLFGEWANKNRRQLIDETNEDVISHELFHQWFGDYVTAESWSNLTLNESFATYGEHLWRQFKRGTASADELAWNDLQRYLSSTGRADPPLVRYYYRDKEEMFDRVSYQKGGAILRYIHAMTGDTIFAYAMQLYLRRNALESAEASQWRLALETATGKDWMPFFNQWYYRGGHPVLNVRYKYDDAGRKATVTIRQQSSPDSAFLYSLALKVALIYGPNDARMEDITITSRSQSFSFPANSAGKLPLVIVDADHVLPGVISEEKSLDLWLQQLLTSGNYISKRLAVDAAIAEEGKVLSPAIVDAALKDSMSGIRLYALQNLSGISRQAWKDMQLPQVKYLLAADGSNKIRAAAFSLLSAWKDRSELSAMYAAVGDSSYLISGSALGALTILNPDTAYVLADAALRQSPKGTLLNAAWTAIVSKGAPADMERFTTAAKYLYGGEKLALAGNLHRYAVAVKDDALFERALTLLADMAKGEAIRGYRLAIGGNVFELRNEYRKGPATRKAILERTAARIIAEEPDDDSRRQYRSMEQ